MASEPTEDAIANFVSFTSTTREQAVSFLKANNLDSQKAINAYFEDPTGPTEVTSHIHAIPGPEADWHFLEQTSAYQSESNVPSFDFTQHDDGPRVPATAPPSRPPSRINMHDATQGAGNDGLAATVTPSVPGAPGGSGKGLSLAEREEQELQQAMAMSLNQDMGQQETGVTSKTETAGEAQFGKATRDHYDEGAWAMTLFNASSQEVVSIPEPEDRKRVDNEPAFLRPTPDNLYLGGFLSILHEIPLAREALLLRSKMLSDYGHDAQWWNGQPINLPKIVTVNEASAADNDWDDILYETQRLMAFLDSTQRAFGSSDALASLKQVNSYSSDSEEIIARFLETWHGAAIRADPDSPLATVFMSRAYKKSPFDEGDEPISKELFTFEPVVDQDHGQTLYDVLDTAIWSDRPGEELDDVWLEHVGEVLIMKLDSLENAKSVDVKVPAVFYPDRYLSSYRDLSRDLRTKKLQAQGAVMKFDQLIQRYTMPPTPMGTLTRKEILEKAADAIPVALKTAMEGKSERMSPEVARERAEQLPRKLKAYAANVEAKLKALQSGRQRALETVRRFSKSLTEPSEPPSESPVYKYTLRGVCTEPHVTYILKRRNANDTADAIEVDGERSDYQWWRISFSTEDGKARQAQKREKQGSKNASQDGDVVGYTARKVREIEVLKAAREEWRSVLLVYASDAAMNAQVEPTPPQLQGFVNTDNEAFAAECKRNTGDTELETPQEMVQKDAPDQKLYQPTLHDGQDMNVAGYGVSGSVENHLGQEMQERTGSSLIGAGTRHTAKNAVSRALDDDEEWKTVESDEEMADHVEHARAA
ncbi:uncharacterized protein N7459_008415 [Penicillium hispanicum]|uniref:uncharacterized protein n=1 Tax=Penicillium hispanicum TaxID=1080232 RepID=UPI00253FD866|nr:uncharacterized protein N7459_008415 [Penicillium hispanicum]KAJ5573988.1 hypothetical protein N7459_008415 [Penicillium hispanicum]